VVVTPEEQQEDQESDQGEAADGSEATDAQDGGETSGSASESSDGEESGSAVVGGRPERERDASIYYIRVTDDGTIHPERVRRTVEYVDSPMTQTLKSLLRGPTPEELSLGLLNLIPDGTELISARVENGVAYLNFSEEFRFNSMGVEGFIAQLQQIVFSSTEFSTVRRVQILIEGETVEYLGEGVYIGDPLGRDSFS
jgi:spore germination protein GerM